LKAADLASTELCIISGQGFAYGITSIGQQLGVQAIGVVATFTYTAIVTFILLKIVGMITGLRVTPDEETQGLDIIDHEERGYDL
jgi:Amt family ammonium transporter